MNFGVRSAECGSGANAERRTPNAQYLMVCSFVLGIAGAFAPVFVIQDGKLTTTLNANEKNITNAAYINFGTVDGFGGYGLRDNAGTLEFKNDAGSWAVLGTGGGGGGGGTVTSIGITGIDGITVADSPVTTSGNITLGINWATMTPGTLSATSVNGATGTTHTHAITASSNPGASASLLKTDGTGLLQLQRLTIADYLRSPTYTSGLTGFSLDGATGNAEFNNGDFRGAIHASVIVYGEVQATAGTILVSKSAAKLRTDVTIPAAPTYGTTTVNVDVVDADGLSHASSQLFAVNDVIHLKDGFAGATWLTVSSVSDQTTFWRYVCTIRAGTNNVTYRTGLGAADYGGPGAGFIVQTADATNAPYLQMATHSATFTSANASGTLVVKPQLRLGNLNGGWGYSSNIFGFAVGEYGVADSWLTVDPTNGLQIFAGDGALTLNATGLAFNDPASKPAETTIIWYDGATDWPIIRLSPSYATNTLAVNLVAESPDGVDTLNVETLFGAFHGTSGGGIGFALESFGPSYAATPALQNKAFARLYGVSPNTFLGLTVGSTNAPTHMLDVYGTGWFQNNLTIGSGGTGNDLRKLILNGGSGAAGGGEIDFQANSVTGVAIGTENSIAGSGSNTKGTFFSLNATYRLYGMGAGTGTFDASGNLTATSDERLKEIEGSYTRGLDDLRAIQPKIGKWKESTGYDRTQSYVWAVTAQNALATIPEAVGLDANGDYTVDQGVLLATAINAIHELEARLLALEGRTLPEPKKDDRGNKRAAELKAAMEKRKKAEGKVGIRK